MRFIRSRPGLVLWLAIALLIAVVPLWRLRAMRQWKKPAIGQLGDSFAKSNRQQSYGLTPPLEKAIARRFPDEVVAQLSPLRGYFSSGGGDTEKAAKRAYFARYDALEARFPDANIVRAQRLREMTRGALAIDEGPEAARAQSTPARFKQRWLDGAELERGVQSARRAAQIEPDNAFFPWMESVLNFSLKRNDAALDALRRAGDCARFDDYTGASIAGRIALLKRVQTTGWEDDMTEFSSALLPHLRWIRSGARAAMERARLVRRAGDEARALQIADFVQRAGARMALSESSILIDNIVGKAICYIAWSGATEALPDTPKFENFYSPFQGVVPKIGTPEYAEHRARERIRESEARANYGRALLQRFSRLARAQNSDDVARAGERIFADLQTLDLNAFSETSSNSPWVTRIQQLTRTHWIGAIALRCALVGAALWLILWPLARSTKSDVPTMLARRATLIAALFSAGATAVLLIVISRAPTIMFVPYQNGVEPNVPDPLTIWDDNLRWILLAVWGVPFAIALVAARSAGTMRGFWGALGLLMLAGWVRGVSGIVREITRGPNTFESPQLPFSLPLVVACGALGGWLLWRWARPRGLLLPTAIAALLWGVLVVALTPLFGDGTPLFEIVQTLACALGACGLVLWLWQGRTAPQKAAPQKAVPAPVDAHGEGRLQRGLAVAGLLLGANLLWNGLIAQDNSGWASFLATFGILLGAALALFCAVLVIRSQRDTRLGQLCLIMSLCAFVLLAVSSFGPNHGIRMINRMLASANAILFLVSPFLFVGRGHWLNGKSTFSRSQRDTSAPQSHLLAQIGARAHTAAGTLALLSAVAYFGIALWTIPIERDTRAMMARQLQIGEVAWLREGMQ